MTDKALSMLVYGPPKVGKSTLATSSPAPRLYLDVETGSRLLKGIKKIRWNPMDGSPPPKADGTWDTCVVHVQDYEVALKAYEWLRSGKHEFKSVILDSITEFQSKAKEAVNGRNRMQTQHWGDLLAKVSYFGKDLRDLSTHYENPVESVVIIATETVDRDGDGSPTLHRPSLQGSIASQIPYWYDICGYYYKTQSRNEAGEIVESRNLLVSNNPEYIAGSRVPGLPDVLFNPNIEVIINKIFEDEE